MAAAHRAQIRSLLQSLVLHKYFALPPFVRNKLVKVPRHRGCYACGALPITVLPAGQTVADMAKWDWPAEDPNFLNSIIEVAAHPSTSDIGLSLIRALLEQFISDTDSSVPSERKDQVCGAAMQRPSCRRR